MSINIAIVGPPESGKSALAQALATELDALVVDDYVEEVGKESDLALGQYATYIGNGLIGLGRYARERTARLDNRSVITVGTMIETCVYNAIDGINEKRYNEFTEANLQRVQSMMTLCGFLLQDTWEYDHVFYLSGATPVPDQDEITFEQAVVREIPQALDAFKINYTTLDGTLDEQVAAVKLAVSEKIEVEGDAVEATATD